MTYGVNEEKIMKYHKNLLSVLVSSLGTGKGFWGYNWSGVGKFDCSRRLSIETDLRLIKECILCSSLLKCLENFLNYMVEHQEFVLKFWKRSLNPLTWTEILRQVLVAAGYGSKQSTLRRESLNKEGNRMAKYGLRPSTLKGELFAILSEQGNNGLKVSELAKSFQIVKLNLASTTDELELLICSTLSSDITLFEKISPSAYRLRIDPITKGAEDFQSDTEDSGSVDDDYKDSGTDSSGDDESELDSATANLSQIRHMGRKMKNNMLTIYSEIDDSDPGEVWVLGLMEGEYSDLNVEEKLNALVALVDITSSGSSIRMEEPVRAITESIPDNHHGSGAKIKRSSAKQHNFPKPFWGHVEHMYGTKDIHTSPDFLPVDSLATISQASVKEKSSSKRNALRWLDGSKTKDFESKEVGSDVHPMQSVYLGSDRRYNRYWLFLGPCSAEDPGHRRVYFESSEDGHWEVIDTEEVIYSAFLFVLCGLLMMSPKLIFYDLPF
ncbi:hypothetical protein HHK36_024045 [Tetracentron sinense]|uniref:WHIM2 domain-containing protein n=1 Tax=Tetracentron sinense TaxID=13715 RepID=A0A834YKA2_TETSI|nr:hypothetical protein HHK36_024045 [Tetracentron sinense]